MTFKKVSAALAKDPQAKVSEVCKRLNLSQTLYYNAKAKRAKTQAPKKTRTKPRASGYQRLKATAPAPTNDGRLLCLVGSPDQVRAFMGGVL